MNKQDTKALMDFTRDRIQKRLDEIIDRPNANIKDEGLHIYISYSGDKYFHEIDIYGCENDDYPLYDNSVATICSGLFIRKWSRESDNDLDFQDLLCGDMIFRAKPETMSELRLQIIDMCRSEVGQRTRSLSL